MWIYSKMEHFNEILQPHVQVSQVKLSYIRKLFPDFEDSLYIVLHKKIPDNAQHAKEKFVRNNEGSHDESSKNYGVCGSPLGYSFDSSFNKLDKTMFLIRHNWRKEEESYLPLSRNDACTMLNACIGQLSNSPLPMIALCDGEDLKQSRLIGSIFSDDEFASLEVVSTGVKTLAMVSDECHEILQEHIKQLCVQEHDVKVSTFKSFELFGTKQERIDWDINSRNDFEGSITVEAYSSSLILNPKRSKNTLIVEVNAGWKESPLKKLRDQFHLLIEYLSILEIHEEDINSLNEIKLPYLKEPDRVRSKNWDLLMDFASFQLVGDGSIEETDYINNECAEIDINLMELLQTVSSRRNRDITDLLWEVLIEASDYQHMVSDLEIILRNIEDNNYAIQVNDTNSTRLVKLIFVNQCVDSVYSEDSMEIRLSNLTSGSTPLQLVIDMGIEKLTRDYLFILRGAQFDLHDIRKKLISVSINSFSVEIYKKQLVTLAQIHICLECILFIETHLKCPIQNVRSIFPYAYKEFLSKQSPLQHYNDLCDRFYTLSVPLPNAIANELSKMSPDTWRTTLSSHSAAVTRTTTMYYSKIPIFPTNIYLTDDVSVQEETVYGIKATLSSTKYKRL